MKLLSFSELTDSQLADVVTIYREAFEAPWEWPVERIAGLAVGEAAPARGCALALADGGAALGLAVADYLPAANLSLLHYLAVAPARRSAGAGAILLNAVRAASEDWAHTAGLHGCRGTLAEVERVEGPPPAADRTQRQRRVAFYRRHGAIHTGAEVPRPPWASPEMPEWEIMLLPGTAWDGNLDANVRRDVCLALMVEGYGAPADTQWLRAWLDRC